jgi:hypothetical protein
MKIAFYKGTRPFPQSLFNQGVRWWTGGIYSHCELVFSDNISASSSFIDHGVRFKKIEYDDCWDFLDLKDFDELSARCWFQIHVYEKYDLLNLLGFIWRRKDGSSKKWTCSEACASALKIHEPWRYDPNTLYSTLKYCNARKSYGRST